MTTTASQPTGTETRHIAAVRQLAARAWRNSTLRALVGALLISGLVIFVRHAGWLQPLELLVYDKLVVASSHPVTNKRFLLIGMTEHDIQRWHYPLSDELFADLLERVASWHPRVIGIDIYRDIPEPPGSDKLKAVLKRHPEIVWIFKMAEGPAHPLIPPPAALVGTDQVALADLDPDSGQIARRGLLYADDGKDSYPGLGMALALRYLAVDGIQPQAGDDDNLRLGKAVIPPLDETRGPYMRLDTRGYQVLLDYHNGARPFTRVSIADAMDRDMSAQVRGRAIIIGDTLESQRDDLSTPFNTGFGDEDPDRGIEIHAQLADQIIRQARDGAPLLTGLPRTGEAVWIVVWAIAGAGLGLMIRGTIPAVVGSGAGLVAIAAIVYVAFGRALLLPAVPAAMAWVGTAALTNQMLYAATNRARAQLRRSFEHYLPPAVVAQMVAADSLPHLGGERREISVLFTDVAGFTTFSERMDPEALASLTNEYFEGVCGAIFAHGGLVNAFIGDSVLAFFGAPIPQADHVDRAIAASLDVDRFATQFIVDQAERGVEFGHTRIGIHTGFAFVGNVGTKQRLQYTALGDMLNTGSRLEGLNKAIGTRIAASGDIARESKNYRCRKVGSFVVKGRVTATEVYTPLDPNHPDPEFYVRYDAAFRAAEACEPEAIDLFEALYRENPDDACVAFHRRRLAAGEEGTAIHMDSK